MDRLVIPSQLSLLSHIPCTINPASTLDPLPQVPRVDEQWHIHENCYSKDEPAISNHKYYITNKLYDQDFHGLRDCSPLPQRWDSVLQKIKHAILF